MELSARRKAALALTTVALALGFLLVVGEVVVRLLGLGVEVFDTSDPVLGHRFKRNLDVDVQEMGRRIHYRTNALGFRGPEVESPKKRTRIVMLGDSFTAGQDWHEEDSFPRLVEKALGVEVVNLGVPAWDTGVELVALEQVALPLQPDAVVLVMFVGNDIRENSRALSPLPRPTFSVENGQLVQHPFTPRGERVGQWLLGRSALYAWQKHVVRRLMFRMRARAQGGDPMHAVFSAKPDENWDGAWRVTEALLARFKERCAQAGVPLLVVVIPDVVQVDDRAWEGMVAASPSLAPLERELPQRRLAAIFAKLGIPSVDLLPVLRSAGNALGGEDPLYDGHLVKRGHRVAADAILTPLRDLARPAH